MSQSRLTQHNKIKDVESKAQLCKMMSQILEMIDYLENSDFNRFHVELWNDSDSDCIFDFDLVHLKEGATNGLIRQLRTRYKDLETSFKLLDF